MAKARQTIRVRIKKNGNNKSGLKPCGTCGGTGVVKKK